MLGQAVQVFGAVLILVAFAGNQLGRLAADDRRYLVLNLVGSIVLAVLAYADADLGFLLLETVWAAVSAVGLVRSRGRSGADGSGR